MTRLICDLVRSIIIVCLVIVCVLFSVACESRGYTDLPPLFQLTRQVPPYVTFGVDKAEASAGALLTYELLIENNTNENLRNVLARVAIDPRVVIEEGATRLIRDGRTLPLADGWRESGVNLGTIKNGGKSSIVIGVRVPSSLQVGTIVTATGQIELEDMPTQTYGISTLLVPIEERAILQGGSLVLRLREIRPGVMLASLLIDNNGQAKARNVSVYVQLPLGHENNGTSIGADVTIDADNAEPIVVSRPVIEGTENVRLIMTDNTATLTGSTDLHDCPNGCTIPASFLQTPLIIGSVAPGTTVGIEFEIEIQPITN